MTQPSVPPDDGPEQWVKALAHVAGRITYAHDQQIVSLAVSGYSGISVKVRGGEDAVDDIAYEFTLEPANTGGSNYTRTGQYEGYRVDVYSTRTRTCQCGCRRESCAS